MALNWSKRLIFKGVADKLAVLQGMYIFTTYNKKIMGLFSNIFGSNDSEKETIKNNVNWIPLNSLEQLEEIKEVSKTQTIAIFKHSTRCAISRGVLKQFENSFDDELSTLKVYYLDLLNYREISNEVGYQFQVLHQSPQLLVIRNEVEVAHASHYDIMSIDLKRFI